MNGFELRKWFGDRASCSRPDGLFLLLSLLQVCYHNHWLEQPPEASEIYSPEARRISSIDQALERLNQLEGQLNRKATN
ncbi:hypothetical protein [Hydrocarboniclastica marina]|uniref:Uncharacterized protein n=1 Tax=Hydrocarboniclastica marina TaxID=2259620 RepID=A0A4V1D8V3_9ALTE|nr:hypothetical protein [Hydrocarboniclastica marina]QCF26490.1 hypothetical protein soil367_11385 [Hydrocarboniclastica marina]